jgi:hypothetical protein
VRKRKRSERNGEREGWGQGERREGREGKNWRAKRGEREREGDYTYKVMNLLNLLTVQNHHTMSSV